MYVINVSIEVSLNGLFCFFNMKTNALMTWLIKPRSHVMPTVAASAATLKFTFSADINQYIWVTCAKQHMSAFLSDGPLAQTTNRHVSLALDEGLQVFSSLVVFPSSFSLAALVQWVHCWNNNTGKGAEIIAF